MTTPTSAQAIRRIAVLTSSAADILALHGPLLRELLRRRHRILCLAPDFTSAQLDQLAAMGIECEAYQHYNHKLRLTAEAATIKNITRIFKLWRPHIALNIGGIDALYGAIAARRAKVGHNVCMPGGLAELIAFEHPAALFEDTDKGKAADNSMTTGRGMATRISRSTASRRRARTTRITHAAQWHRWRALRGSDVLVLHNDDDLTALERLDVLPGRLPVYIVRGAGVDLTHFAHQPLRSFDEGLTFAMISDLRQRKGVAEFCAAAAKLNGRGTGARFVLMAKERSATGPRNAADIIDAQTLGALYPGIAMTPWVADNRPALTDAHIIVQPSHFGEGLPQILLEALAIGRPLITTDIAGCRNVVDERVNGCLVRPGDEGALADAMMSFLRRPDLIASMARASRAKAERLFDVTTVNQHMIEIMQLE